MSPEEVVAAHRPYGLDCKCGRPINSDEDWARHFVDALQLSTEEQWPGVWETRPWMEAGLSHRTRLTTPWVDVPLKAAEGVGVVGEGTP